MANFYKIRAAVFVSSNNPTCKSYTLHIYVWKSVKKTHNIIYFNLGIKTNAHRPEMSEW